MARRGSTGPGSGMTRYERLTGFCYLPFYLFLLQLLMTTVLPLLGVQLTDLTLNLLFYAINFAAILLIFHHFLSENLHNIRFWSLIQAIILGFVFYYALNLAVNLTLHYFAPELVNPNEAAVESLAKISGAPFLICVILVGPLIEEVLLRGLIFGSLHRHSRIGAYVISVLLFSAIHLWQFVGKVTVPTLLLSALQYVPGGIALGWTYEKSGTIWGSILLHCIINAISMGLLALLPRLL